MKQLFSGSIICLLMLFSLASCAQEDKSKRPSPPATVTQNVGAATIKIDYSQPSVKGRTIGKDLEPMAGKVWRTGANEATVFETNKDITVESKPLAAGKYALFSIANGADWTIIFNKKWEQWGAYDYKEADDALRVNVKSAKAAAFSEKLTFTVSPEGKVSILWGDTAVDFNVK
ncbi:MAG: DUF2911 domain-containing protein [Ferruginibacter sp.]